MVLPIVDAYAALAGWMHRVCADLAGCYEIPVWCLVRLCWFVALPVHVGRPSPMVTTGLFRIDFLILTIVNGARPGRCRMIPDLQPAMAERTGSRHARSSFHPSSRLARSSFHCGWTVHNPLRRGGPPRPPARIEFGLALSRLCRSRRMPPRGSTIVNGARPGSRRMISGLQPAMAERTGSRHARSSFHPASRLARSSFHCG